MRDRRTTPVVYRLHPTRTGLSVAVMGVVAIVVGLVAPATAATTADKVKEVHKSYVCKYVGTPGEDERLQTGQNPIYVDNHSIAGKDVVAVGDTFADAHGYSVVIVANTKKLFPEPSIRQCPGYVPPTTSTTSIPTTSTSSTSTTSTSTTTTEPPATTTTTPVTETPDTGATVPSTTTTVPVVTEEPPAEESPEAPATVAPAAPTQPVQPQVGAVQENAVPQAQTDGADLVGQGTGWTLLQPTLVGAGLLLLAAGGLLSVRRERTSG